MPPSEGDWVKFADKELAEIRRLLDKGTAELEHGNLRGAQEAMLTARHAYKQLAAQIAEWAGQQDKEEQQPIFTLRLAQADQAIARSERRLAAYLNE